MSTQPSGRLEPAAIDLALERLADLLATRVAQRLNTDTRARAQRDAGESPWMGIDTAARYLDWPKQRLYKLTATGEIPHYKHDGRLLFHRDELDTWLRRYAQGGGGQ